MNGIQIATTALAAVSLGLGLGCATPEALKPDRAWNQAAVTTLAGELVSRVASASALANEQTVDVDQIESVSVYRDNLRILERQCRELQSDLEAGKGYSQTLWLYGDIKRVYQIVYESPSWHLIEDELAASERPLAEVLSQLDGYYGKL